MSRLKSTGFSRGAGGACPEHREERPSTTAAANHRQMTTRIKNSSPIALRNRQIPYYRGLRLGIPSIPECPERRTASSESGNFLCFLSLQHVSIANDYTILDVGCGGGRTVSKLAAMATQGKVYGVDYSEESVAATNRERTRTGSNSAALKCGTAPFPSCRLSLMTDGKRSILQTSGKYAGTSRRVSFSSDKSPAVRKLVILSAFEGCAKNRNRSKGQPMRSLRSFASLRMTGSFLPGYISFLRPVRNRNWVYRLISHAPSL